MEQILVDEHGAAEILGLTSNTIKMWRIRKEGPPYVKVGKRSVRYLISDLKAWLEANRVNLEEKRKAA